MFSKEEFAIVISNLRFINRTIFMISCVDYEKCFITLGPGINRRSKRMCLWVAEDAEILCGTAKTLYQTTRMRRLM